MGPPVALLFCGYYGSTSGFLFTPADGADYSEISFYVIHSSSLCTEAGQ